MQEGTKSEERVQSGATVALLAAAPCPQHPLPETGRGTGGRSVGRSVETLRRRSDWTRLRWRRGCERTGRERRAAVRDRARERLGLRPTRLSSQSAEQAIEHSAAQGNRKHEQAGAQEEVKSIVERALGVEKSIPLVAKRHTTTLHSGMGLWYRSDARATFI